jgi:5-methylcytosine-specific restriction enzyme A
MGIFARLCRHAGCAYVTPHSSGYCEQHQRAEAAARRAREAALGGKIVMPDGRQMSHQEFYRSAAWSKLRRYVLQRDGYRCATCRERASVVDHVTAIRAGGAPLDASNCRAMCWGCHSRKTVSEDGGYGHGRSTTRTRR